MRSPTFALPGIFSVVVPLCLVIMAGNAQAQGVRFQWGTSLTVSEQYDDNIDLEETNKRADWITSVTPGLRGSLETEETTATLDYRLGLISYAKASNENTLRHTASLTTSSSVTEHVTVDLSDSFSYSEDTLLTDMEEAADPSLSVSAQRNPYYLNTAGCNINYLFGSEGSLYVDFVHTYYENTAPGTESRQSFNPSVGLTHWFNTNHGVTISSSFARTEYELSQSQDHRTGSIAYTYRFNQMTQASLTYSYDLFAYQGTSPDYLLLDGSIGLSHRFSEQASGSISLGYSGPADDYGSNLGGINGAVSFSWQTPRYGFDLDGSSEYRMPFFEDPTTGFSWNRNISARFRYQVRERLSSRLSAFINQDEFEATGAGTDTSWGASTGLDFTLLDWLTGSLEYQYRQMDADTDRDYVDNRVTAILTASYSGKPRTF